MKIKTETLGARREPEYIEYGDLIRCKDCNMLPHLVLIGYSQTP